MSRVQCFERTWEELQQEADGVVLPHCRSAMRRPTATCGVGAMLAARRNPWYRLRSWPRRRLRAPPGDHRLLLLAAVYREGNPQRVPKPSRDASLRAKPAGSADYREGNPQRVPK